MLVGVPEISINPDHSFAASSVAKGTQRAPLTLLALCWPVLLDSRPGNP